MAEIYNLSKYVLEELRENRIDKNTVVSLLQKLNEREDIAVIGMGVRYGKSDSYQDFWELLRDKRSLIERCPASRRRLSADAQKEDAFCKGSFVPDPARFDPEAFSVTRQEAEAMPPAYRLMLEATYRALEDGGHLGERADSERTGVFIGCSGLSCPAYQGSLATTLAQVFDLRGGACVIDAGSVSSDLAIIDACQSIRSGRCTAAVVGGLWMGAEPLKQTYCTDAVFAHGDSELTRSFDNEPGGLYPAEGAAAVLLKPLAQALEDGELIHGVIIGHSVCSSGAGGSPEAIEALVADAVRNARVDIHDVELLEIDACIGKAEEGSALSGLISGFRTLTDRTQFCGLSSLSGNMGCLQSASGVFRLIKLCLSMQKKLLPPQYRFNEPTDAVNFIKSPFYVSDCARPWPADDAKPRQSAMYAFGHGGNHVMLVLQQAPEAASVGKGRNAEVFVLSAATKDAFRTRIRDTVAFLCDAKESLTDICYTASVCRPSYRQYRLAVLCRCKEQLAQTLEEYLSKEKAPINMFVGRCEQAKSERMSVDGFTMEEIASGYCEGKDYVFDELFDGVEKALAELPPYPFDPALGNL